MINFENTIISQYANSDTIFDLIEQFNDCLDPRADFDQFYQLVWDVETAKGFGLDIWGRIVGIGRSVRVPTTSNTFGFINTQNSFAPFNQAPFLSANNIFEYYSLPDNAYRSLVMIKALINIIYATAPNINSLLQRLFEGRGRCYFLTLGNMHARYVFEFYLQPYERTLIFENSFLPNPSGVGVEIVEVIPEQTFGFFGSGLQPFNQGTFYR